MHSKGYIIKIRTFESNGEGNNNRTRKKISPENIPREDSRRALTQDQIDDAIIVLATRSGGSYSEVAVHGIPALSIMVHTSLKII
jgi:hypothetical protein